MWAVYGKEEGILSKHQDLVGAHEYCRNNNPLQHDSVTSFTLKPGYRIRHLIDGICGNPIQLNSTQFTFGRQDK